jgi:hypothetical protein
MTPQEIQDREGFLILASQQPARIGDIRVIHGEDDLAPPETTLVVIGYATKAEALRYARKYPNVVDPSGWKYLLKVVAE